MERDQDPTSAAYDISELASRRQASGEPWLPFLNVSTLTAGLYFLHKRDVDPQQPHDRDEVYFVLKGKALLRVEGEDTQVHPGSVVYVKAEAEHCFHSISEDLQVLVFFSEAKPD